MRSWPSSARHHVAIRDQGKCAEPGCGLDTLALARELRELHDAAWESGKHARWDALRVRIHFYVRLGFPKGRLEAASRGQGSLWDMDHIREVVNGGGGCGLDNLQTLCAPHHAAKTKKLAGDLAQKRRDDRDKGLVARRAQ